MLTGTVVPGGCAVNPVSGKNDFVLISEEAEIEMGRKAAPEILKEFGPYDNAELQAYVQRVGEGLAAQSHRANLVYRFTVLDSADVNAFALPGGYVYITRGMLAYLNSEAQLAAVLGHEIGHVTARHSVQQQSAAQAADIGLTLGSILIPGLDNPVAQQVFGTLGGALLSGYGRDHELEADRLGAAYMAKSGYNPHEIIEVIGVLKDQETFEKQLAAEEQREPRVYHGLFASHPDNDTRLQQVVASAEALKTPAATRVNQNGFLNMLDGLIYGDSEREGVRRGNQFYHKDLGFALSFPAGWRVENRPDSLIATAPQGDGVLQLSSEDINKRVTPEEFLRTRLKLANLQKGEPFTHQGMEGYTAVARTRTPYGQRLTRFTVIYFGTQAFVFAGAGKDAGEPYRYDQDFLASAKSFHALTEAERPLAAALRLGIIHAGNNTRFADLARASRIPHHAEEQLRLLNHYYPAGEPAPGASIKIVR
ncbi:MAG: M48 family metalloprotease [Proteobacteria bacterium]|nr:M48 family metalloprotease [Pseudomonadota bacterium]